jgi:CHAD domain-containing protein
MEIEAKFAIPNRQVYRSLLRLRTIAGFDLVPVRIIHVTDHYLDTADGRLLNAGYACRLRTEGEKVIATLKGLGEAADAIHRRDEQEVRLAAWDPDVHTWPAGPARELALSLTAGRPLQPLLDMEQRRAKAKVMAGPRVIAEWSLDEVRAAVGRRPAFYYELEAELLPDGTEPDLSAIAAELQGKHGLMPEPRSKFQRALATLRNRGTEVEGHLSAAERASLDALAAGADRELARRGQVVLGWADGLPTREIVARSGLSDGRVRFWLRAFRNQRMAMFEEEQEPQSAQSAQSEQSEQSKQPERAGSRHGGPVEAERSSSDRPPLTAPPVTAPTLAAPLTAASGTVTRRGKRRHALPTVAEFCEANGVDMTHAAFVAERAEELFNQLKPVHRLPRKRRKLLKHAALLSSVGAAGDPARPQRAGRDLILAQPLHDVSTNDRLALACIVAFQRERARPDKEPTMSALEPKQRAAVMALAALLHVAEALDFSRTQSTVIDAVEDAEKGRCEIVLSGPAAEVDALQATERGEAWFQIFKQELIFVALPPPAGAEAADEAAGIGPLAATQAGFSLPPEFSKLAGDEPMSEAGRKVLLLHFSKMLANEAGTRAGEDIEALHDMRVATRRMRAAYGIFAEHYEADAVAPFNKALRRTGRSLGTVRDLDVLIEKAETFQAGFAPEEAASLEPLLDEWRTRRAVARRHMLDHLDSAAYHEFVQAFGDFLMTPGAGAHAIPPGEPMPFQVRHIVPRLIFTRYEVVRAYEPIIDAAPPTTYHALRIDCKRLRYALEFFRDVLGAEAPGLIKQVTEMQDLLGALQDSHVAEGLIEEFLREQTKRKKKAAAAPLDGVQAYLLSQHGIQEDLLVQFPRLWAGLVGPDFRRSLALAVAAL